MVKSELEWLAEHAAQHTAIVELGSYLGKSTRALADNTDGFVLAIDDFIGPRDRPESCTPDIYDRFCRNVSDLLENGKVRVLRMKHEDLFGINLGFVPDMVWIDGDHEYENFRRDLTWALSVIKDGGLVCGHDADMPDIQQVLRDVLGIDLGQYPDDNIWWARVKR